MKVFISWSGEPSHTVALALRSWLQSVIQSIDPYVSTEDIEKGASWFPHIAQQLNETAFGIICVTRANADSRWLNFEAGALFKSVENVQSRVAPFLIDLNKADLVGPLAQLQATEPTRDDVALLVKSLNASSEQPLSDARLDEAIEMWWPRLEAQLEAARQSAESQPRPESRSPDDMIKEILENTRSMQRRINPPLALSARRVGAVNVTTEEQEGYRTKNSIHNIWEFFNGAGIEHEIRFVDRSTVEVRVAAPLPLPENVRANLDSFAERRGLTIDVIAKN
jgi:hypothetical protein